AELVSAMHSDLGVSLIERLVADATLRSFATRRSSDLAVYRQKGFDARAESDLRNAATAEESLVAGGASYLGCADAAACQTALPGFGASNVVTLNMTGTRTTQFAGTSTHPTGSGKTGNC